MSIRMFQRAVLYIKEIQDIGLFGVMGDAKWFAAFGGSPLYYVMLPLIGLLITVLAITNGYELAKASNKNFDKWLGFIISAVCAITASISLYGAVLASAFKFNFALGPWFFLGGVVLAGVHQCFMMALNAYRAYESLPGSNQRIHYLQAALNNLLITGLITAITGAVIFVMLTPVAPLVGSLFAFTAVALTAVNLVWRLTPYNWKQEIKGWFNLGKNEFVINEEPNTTEQHEFKSDLSKDSSILHHRIFTRRDYSAEIKNREFNAASLYLRTLIENKINFLINENIGFPEDKRAHKINILTHLYLALTNGADVNKAELLNRYPLAYQSFWAEKGDVEQLIDAVLVLQDKRNEQDIVQSAPIPTF